MGSGWLSARARAAGPPEASTTLYPCRARVGRTALRTASPWRLVPEGPGRWPGVARPGGVRSRADRDGIHAWHMLRLPAPASTRAAGRGVKAGHTALSVIAAARTSPPERYRRPGSLL